jgi:hypothetical protein
MGNETKQNQVDLQVQIQHHWKELNKFLSSVSKSHITETYDAQQWTIKDYIFQVISWEKVALAFLVGIKPHKALNISEVDFNNADLEHVHQLIYTNHKNASLEEALQQLRFVHERLLQALEMLSDEDLEKHYPFTIYSTKKTTEYPTVLEMLVRYTFQNYMVQLAHMRTLIEN